MHEIAIAESVTNDAHDEHMVESWALGTDGIQSASEKLWMNMHQEWMKLMLVSAVETDTIKWSRTLSDPKMDCSIEREFSLAYNFKFTK